MHLNHAPAQSTTSTLAVSSALFFRPLEVPAHLTQVKSKEVFKQTYLESLKNIKSQAETLRQSIIGLLNLGVSCHELVAWAKAAGQNDRYSQKLLSQILLDLGIRRREPGAGPKSPPEAFQIEREVYERYGDEALKLLRAACIVAKARNEGELEQSQAESEQSPYPDRDKGDN